MEGRLDAPFQRCVWVFSYVFFPVIEEKCYGMYGCFRNDMEWRSERRPIALHPQNVSEIDTRYAVFNDRNRTHPHFLNESFLDADVEDLRDETIHWIKPNGMIYFITHGFLESGKTKWVTNTRALGR